MLCVFVVDHDDAMHVYRSRACGFFVKAEENAHKTSIRCDGYFFGRGRVDRCFLRYGFSVLCGGGGGGGYHVGLFQGGKCVTSLYFHVYTHVI